MAQRSRSLARPRGKTIGTMVVPPGELGLSLSQFAAAMNQNDFVEKYEGLRMSVAGARL
jgi:hypothetical protein